MSFKLKLDKPALWLTTLVFIAAAGHGDRSYSAPAKAATSAPIQIHLTAERELHLTNSDGTPVRGWQAVTGASQVQSGDVLRCTLRVENKGALPVKNFALTQPIPTGTTYLNGYAQVDGADGVQTLYTVSAKSGYSEKPTVTVTQTDGSAQTGPAAPEQYRGIRWLFTKPIAAGQVITAIYAEKVR